MRAQADDATDPVPELVERMVRRRRWVRARRLGARALVGALAVGRWWGVIGYLRGDWASLHPILEHTLFDSALLVMAFVALGSTRVGPQLVARAILLGQLWLFVPVVHALWGFGLLYVMCIALPLVLLGADRLDTDDGPFRPIFFRNTLVACILINGSLAIHGARLLLLRFAISEPGYGFVDPWGLIVVACLLAAALGLYWLRTAALTLPVLIAAVRLPASLDGILHSHQGVPPTLHAWFFFAANVALILTVVPVVWGLIRLRWWRRTKT